MLSIFNVLLQSFKKNSNGHRVYNVCSAYTYILIDHHIARIFDIFCVVWFLQASQKLDQEIFQSFFPLRKTCMKNFM